MTALKQTVRLLSGKPQSIFRVETGQDWKQTFGTLPYEDGTFELVLITKRGNRAVGEARFPNQPAAERWARNRVACNGPFDVY